MDTTKTLVLDAMGVIFSAGDDVAELGILLTSKDKKRGKIPCQ
jgi:hypothetical protein